MALRSSAGVVSKDMSVVSAISCERLFVVSMPMAAQSQTYFLFCCTAWWGVYYNRLVVGFERVLSVVDDGCVLEGLVPEVEVSSGLVEGWEPSVEAGWPAIWGGGIGRRINAFG